MSAWPAVEIIVPFRSRRGTPACLESLQSQEGPSARIRVLPLSPRDRPASAVTEAVRASRATLVAVVDAAVRPATGWLARLAGASALCARVGACDGTLIGSGAARPSRNAVGGIPRDTEAIDTRAFVARRDALLNAGGPDARAVLLGRDPLLAVRMRRAGWTVLHIPPAQATIVRAPGTTSAREQALFDARRGILDSASTRGMDWVAAILDSPLVRDPILRPALYHVVAEATRAAAEVDSPSAMPGKLRRLAAALPAPAGLRERIVRRARAAAGIERPAILLYDYALHFMGGGQRYGLLLARAIEDRTRPSYLTHMLPAGAPATLDGLPFPYPIETLPVDRRLGKVQVNPSAASRIRPNPLDPVSRRSAAVPIFVNANMATAVRPRADLSVFVCHFPDSPRQGAFHVPAYDLVVCSSRYASGWMRRLWGIRPDVVVYPPVSDAARPRRKTRTILSVARFDAIDSKAHPAMIEAFDRLWRSEPAARRWRLVLAGATIPGRADAARIRALALARPHLPIEILADVPEAALRRLRARAAIFWHFCGVRARAPVLREHFGMSIVEAMGAGCVPVVFDGGGMRESVRQGRDGLRARTVDGLVAATRRLVRSPALRARLARSARARAREFSAGRFARAVRTHLGPRIDAYARPVLPCPADVPALLGARLLPPDPGGTFRPVAPASFAGRSRRSGSATPGARRPGTHRAGRRGT